jgi:hypothetical protein
MHEIQVSKTNGTDIKRRIFIIIKNGVRIVTSVIRWAHTPKTNKEKTNKNKQTKKTKLHTAQQIIGNATMMGLEWRH